MRRTVISAFLLLSTSTQGFAFLGTELGPLLQLVAGQVQEIERLTQAVGIAKDQHNLLMELNEGINRVVTQIQALQTIIDRTQGLDPREVKSLADLNDLLARAKNVKELVDEQLAIKVEIANQAIARSALQSDTSYRMGQEMVAAGSQLAQESQTASPGRATQISAASGAAQMLSQGVELQTLSQIVQLQAISLEFQKSLVERDLKSEKNRRENFKRQLSLSLKRSARP